MPDISRVLEITPVANYLASNDVAKGSLFRGGSLDPKLPITIYMVYKILKRVFDADPTYPNLQPIANYLYELIQKYAFKAAAIVDGNTGGQIAPPSPPSSGVPYPYDWEVSAVSFPLADGESSITFDGTNGTQDLRGYNLAVERGGIGQNTTINTGSYYFWNRATGEFVATPAAALGELWIITPSK